MNLLRGTFSWSSWAKPVWPRWRTVTMIELVLSVLIIAAVSSMLLLEAGPALAKAQMSEGMQAAVVARVAIVEHLAVTGKPLASDVSAQGVAGETAGVPEYEKLLSGSAAFATVAAAAGQSQSKGVGRTESDASQVRYGVRDGSAIVMGRMRLVDGAYRLVVTPAVSADGVVATIHWVCGTAAVPEGLVLAGARSPTQVDPTLLPHNCRRSAP